VNSEVQIKIAFLGKITSVQHNLFLKGRAADEEKEFAVAAI
jgi:hypothetical protein